MQYNEDLKFRPFMQDATCSSSLTRSRCCFTKEKSRRSSDAKLIHSTTSLTGARMRAVELNGCISAGRPHQGSPAPRMHSKKCCHVQYVAINDQPTILGLVVFGHFGQCENGHGLTHASRHDMESTEQAKRQRDVTAGSKPSQQQQQQQESPSSHPTGETREALQEKQGRAPLWKRRCLREGVTQQGSLNVSVLGPQLVQRERRSQIFHLA